MEKLKASTDVKEFKLTLLQKQALSKYFLPKNYSLQQIEERKKKNEKKLILDKKTIEIMRLNLISKLSQIPSPQISNKSNEFVTDFPTIYLKINKENKNIFLHLHLYQLAPLIFQEQNKEHYNSFQCLQHYKTKIILILQTYLLICRKNKQKTETFISQFSKQCQQKKIEIQQFYRERLNNMKMKVQRLQKLNYQDLVSHIKQGKKYKKKKQTKNNQNLALQREMIIEQVKKLSVLDKIKVFEKITEQSFEYSTIQQINLNSQTLTLKKIEQIEEFCLIRKNKNNEPDYHLM